MCRYLMFLFMVSYLRWHADRGEQGSEKECASYVRFLTKSIVVNVCLTVDFVENISHIRLCELPTRRIPGVLLNDIPKRHCERPEGVRQSQGLSSMERSPRRFAPRDDGVNSVMSLGAAHPKDCRCFVEETFLCHHFLFGTLTLTLSQRERGWIVLNR